MGHAGGVRRTDEHDLYATQLRFCWQSSRVLPRPAPPRPAPPSIYPAPDRRTSVVASISRGTTHADDFSSSRPPSDFQRQWVRAAPSTNPRPPSTPPQNHALPTPMAPTPSTEAALAELQRVLDAGKTPPWVRALLIVVMALVRQLQGEVADLQAQLRVAKKAAKKAGGGKSAAPSELKPPRKPRTGAGARAQAKRPAPAGDAGDRGE